ncbi:hypothetical protein DFH94DRAFT_119602 [Russula ochroleuca]|jgi:hypothetical protein|uniref:Uncharacterized protein n=1 Tax=Russula ochroleuca TaxID=152965 RepID=A0A9P5MRH2_9AGAM|nr:hypothetical protein DFH94DRAFT_119602 [Russula ochroleuca]
MVITNIPHHRPTLPVELIYQILEETWRLPLSTIGRRNVLVALPLVCAYFRWIASRLFLQDAHVVRPAYAVHLLSLLQRRRDRLPSRSVEGPLSTDAPADVDVDDLRGGNSSCRSITFHIYDPTSPPDLLHLHLPSPNPTTRALDTTLLALSRDALLAPSLRRIALHYTGWSFTHELLQARLAHIPPHVRNIELRFATPAAFAQRLRQIYLRCFALPMPGVRSLRIYGACPEFVADMASACPALESLETDDAWEVLVVQPSLRPFMSQTVGDGTQVKGPVVSHGSKVRTLESRGNVWGKRETRSDLKSKGRREVIIRHMARLRG